MQLTAQPLSPDAASSFCPRESAGLSRLGTCPQSVTRGRARTGSRLPAQGAFHLQRGPSGKWPRSLAEFPRWRFPGSRCSNP